MGPASFACIDWHRLARPIILRQPAPMPPRRRNTGAPVAVLLGLDPARNPPQHCIHDRRVVHAILKAYVLQEFIKGTLSRFARRFGFAARVSNDGVPMLWALNRNRA